MQALIRSLRPHQWSKNLLLAVPALLAQIWADPGVQIDLLWAFIAFSLAASGGYLINDLLDLEADRRHPEKKSRPLAAGQLPMAVAYLGGPLMLLAGLGIAFFLVNLPFSSMVLTYVVLANAYTVYLKRIMVMDVIVLASLYTLRILAGGAAAGVLVSAWLLAFSVFFFLSLAFAKRQTEFDLMTDSSSARQSGRPYGPEDRDAFRAVGPTCGLLSIVILSLYITSDVVQSLYSRPQLLWLLCPLMLYWIIRVWFLSLRGELHHDPVVFAIRDRVSYFVVACIVVLLLAASS